MTSLTDELRAIARAYIERRTIPVPFSGCLLWLGAVRSSGYGAVKFRRAQWDAHRLAFVAYVGPIPDALEVCHHCDEKLCCEWTHHFLGTHSDNAADASAKGRLARELTADEVREIRELSATIGCRRLARRFGVSKTMIRAIVLRERWRFT